MSMVILIICFATIPLLWGRLLAGRQNKRVKDKTYLYITGTVFLLFLFGVIMIPLAVIGVTLNRITFMYVCFALLGGVLGIVLFLHDRKEKEKFQKNKISKRTLVLFVMVAVLFLLQCLVFVIYNPATHTEFVVETIQTSLATNTVYRYYPPTGYPMEILPAWYEMEIMPIFYAAILRCIPVSISSFLYVFIPIWVLILNYFVVWNFFPEQDDEKRWLACLFLGVLHLCGDYVYLTADYQLMHSGWRGETLVINVFIPFMIVCGIRIFDNASKSDVLYFLLVIPLSAMVGGVGMGGIMASVTACIWIIIIAVKRGMRYVGKNRIS